jgi:hypothetical protein
LNDVLHAFGIQPADSRQDLIEKTGLSSHGRKVRRPKSEGRNPKAEGNGEAIEGGSGRSCDYSSEFSELFARAGHTT